MRRAAHVATAGHLVDHVIPHVPVRQWVLSLPIPLRVLLAAQPELVTPLLQVVQRVITRHLLAAAGRGHHLPHRLRPARRAEGADAARRDAAAGPVPPAAPHRLGAPAQARL
jgi:hypothetical protein